MDEDLQPTEAMIEAGISTLWEMLPGSMDSLYQDIDDEAERSELLSDTVTFIWQAMKEAQNT
ncbi:hypothetical protein RJ932_001940 [Enterobacter hormaechei]|uniref:hypothetical protein n=1 Tax=Enterobacter sp. LU1 TaxID=1848517 RepID=UPI0011EB7FA9|nr:hypothetical protein [Enterobacter sp. LU1]ELD6823023.1 hypothetical protein [Enterobacter hormaechei]QEL46715.1 hypothetical protein FZF21_04590 [Enterobacter sp. LU1]